MSLLVEEVLLVVVDRGLGSTKVGVRSKRTRFGVRGPLRAWEEGSGLDRKEECVVDIVVVEDEPGWTMTPLSSPSLWLSPSSSGPTLSKPVASSLLLLPRAGEGDAPWRRRLFEALELEELLVAAAAAPCDAALAMLVCTQGILRVRKHFLCFS